MINPQSVDVGLLLKIPGIWRDKSEKSCLCISTDIYTGTEKTYEIILTLDLRAYFYEGCIAPWQIMIVNITTGTVLVNQPIISVDDDIFNAWIGSERR